MSDNDLISIFLKFGLAGSLGFIIGLEREYSSGSDNLIGIRDFILFSLLGAVSAFIALYFKSYWVVIAGFFGFLVVLISAYWKDTDKDTGFTTETGAIMTFFIGVLIVIDAREIAIALAIATLAILSQRTAISTFRKQVEAYEIQAILKFLIITFIILPILPKQSLDYYLNTDVGKIQTLPIKNKEVIIKKTTIKNLQNSDSLIILSDEGKNLGIIKVNQIDKNYIKGIYKGHYQDQLKPGFLIQKEFEIKIIRIALSAVKPYKIWLIVVLVSFVSFIGYILIKVVGGGAGIGLTGLIGGLISSTVTTLSFSKRSRENPEMNHSFAMAIILAGSIMFPRLLLEIFVVNRELMLNMALPVLVMGITGILTSVYFFIRSKSIASSEKVQFTNPFSLKSAITFAAIFTCILILTRLATIYLGSVWLPIVSIISGLTDADAIAFSLSDAHQAGTISKDWAAFNLVLGALSNTFMKLFLVFSLGNRQLFKRLIIPFFLIGVSGIISMLVYYDL